jgi:transcriptional regulator with XRE-family HTH domain
MKHRRTRGSKILWQHQYEAFRKRLIEARELAGLSQTEAAKLLGRSQQFVSNCETGERRVDIVEAMEFARAYRQPLRFFAPIEAGMR